MGDNFGGLIPNWLLWFTAALHMLYMVNIGKYFRISIIWMESKPDGQVKLYLQFQENSSPLGMILDHNFDSMIILL